MIEEKSILGFGRQERKVFIIDRIGSEKKGSTPGLKALREKVKGKVIVAFHPHLYSRTKDLVKEFATAFKDADRVLIAPIYAAREVDDGSISSEILAERIRATGVDASALDFADIEKELSQAGEGDTIMTMGAGDIYKIADKLVVQK